MKNRLVIYPYEGENLGYIKHFNSMSEKYIIGSVCASSGSGIIGKDISFAENREAIGIIAEAISFEIIDQNDALLVLKSAKEHLKKKALSMIQYALERKKEVICLMELSDDESNILFESAKKSGTELLLSLCDEDKSLAYDLISKRRSLYTPSVPVIFVGGLTEYCDKEEIIMGLRNAFSRQGYRSSCFVKDEEYCLLKMHSYDFVLKSTDMTKTITELNHFIQAVEEEENPDIIIISLPGTMIKFNEVLVGDFGSYAYLFSQAVSADLLVLSVIAETYSQEFYQRLSAHFADKFGVKLDLVHFSNKLLDVNSSLEFMKPIFFKISQDKVLEALKRDTVSGDIPCCRLLDNEACDMAAQYLIQKMQ